MKSKWFLVVTVIFAVVILIEGYFIYDLNKQKKAEKSIVQLQDPADTLLPKPFKDFDKWNSLKEIQKIQRNMNKMFRDFNSNFQIDTSFSKIFQEFSLSPAVDIINGSNKYIVKVNLPGIENDKINVNVKDGILTIKTKEVEKETDKNSNFIERERFMGNFERSILLPKDVIVSKMKTEYKNGVLTITFPKKK
ncbi:18 kDa heat shock protein [bacterium BMS3Abin04]|nr:18 kDa heat shock protein [bacterium BMS3Abin04]